MDGNFSQRVEQFRQFGYRPHAAQREIHRSGAERKLLVCGRRFGKTTAAAAEATLVMLERRNRVWVAAPTYDLARLCFRKTREFLLRGAEREAERDARRGMELRLTNGSVLEGKSCANPVSLLGEGLDLLVLDEAARVDSEVWHRHLSPTLATGGEALLISTPAGFNWFEELFRNAQEWEEWAVFQFPTEENPEVDDRFLERERERLPDDVYRSEYRAEFTRPSGLVFPEFEPGKHIAECEFDPGLDLVRALDFGFRNPTACLDLQLPGDGEVRVLDEHYRAEWAIEELADYLEETEREYDFDAPNDPYDRWETPSRPRARYCCDPSGRRMRTELNRRLNRPVRAQRTGLRVSVLRLRELLRAGGLTLRCCRCIRAART